MRYSFLWKIAGIITLVFTTLSSYAQVKMSDSIQFDSLEKIIGIIFTLGGIFLAFMQLKMANKMAEMEAKIYKVIADTEKAFTKKIEDETDKLETKINLSGKEIEAKMATRHDIDNLKTVMKLSGDITALATDALKEQIKNLKQYDH